MGCGASTAAVVEEPGAHAGVAGGGHAPAAQQEQGQVRPRDIVTANAAPYHLLPSATMKGCASHLQIRPAAHLKYQLHKHHDLSAVPDSCAVIGVQAELKDTSEQLVLRLEEEKDKEVSELKGMMEGDPDSAAALLQDADGVMGVVDKLLAASASWFTGAKVQAKGEELELQKLQLSERSPAERNLAKYSALGKVLVGGVAHAVAALPFGGPVAAALGAIFCQAVTVRLVFVLPAFCRHTPSLSCLSCLPLACTCLPSLLPACCCYLPSRRLKATAMWCAPFAVLLPFAVHTLSFVSHVCVFAPVCVLTL